MNFVEHTQLGMHAAICQGVPTQGFLHLGDTATSEVVTCYKSSCSILDFLEGVYIFLCMGVPRGRGIL